MANLSNKITILIFWMIRIIGRMLRRASVVMIHLHARALNSLVSQIAMKELEREKI